jgi:adenylate cyclase
MLSVSGVLLFVYVTTHLLNHALGLVSLQAQEAGRGVFLAAWRNPVGTALLYGALLIHLALALWSLHQRRTLRMRRWEATQLILGLLIQPDDLTILVVLGK